MRFYLLAAALTAVASAKSVTIPAGDTELPSGWRHEKRASPTEIIDLSVELNQPRLAHLKTRLAAISDPSHAEYGNHLTKDELAAYQAPDENAVRSISSWLRDSGIHDARVSGASIKFRSTVGLVRDLLNADVGHYSFGRSSMHLRARSYTIPDHLAGDIRFIHPLSHFVKPARSHSKAGRESRSVSGSLQRSDVVRRVAKYRPYKLAGRQDQGNQNQPCPDGVTPDCLRKLYGLPNSNDTSYSTGPSPVRFAVAGFLEQYIHYDDVSTFMNKYAPGIQTKGYNFSLALLGNATNPQSPNETAGTEASLDLEYAMALGYPTNITYWAMGGRGPELDSNGTLLPVGSPENQNEPFLDFLQYFLGLPDNEVPHVISISYGDDETGIPFEYASKVCDLFAQLSARGTSVFVASGDGGASGTGHGECYSRDGQRRRMFIPVFPASCPYVTAVGATGFAVPLEASLISGGGFSNYFAAPDFQKGAADEYIKALDKAQLGYYNSTGRAIPDISAPGELFVVQNGGEEQSVRGTSASTPVIAALVALVNEERIKMGKSSTGWLNPLLYKPEVRKTLLDVSLGSNYPCIYDKNDTVPGFAAYAGYDCVTGLGTVGQFNDFLRALV
ncbi:uncharacterized protein JN550_013655 [Neoarthrinium moseri]|uniref:uncharacterized protein n=1 Tax=Neoarthrinium moseri TaxID=1658444 RepID=UPI001FDE89FF|nr:uncharacterized protein JN550_013655 [Neoarthrinium moseri]KAI1856853.1 hypothetical protein JN550_013655 [Neoarthrinium moseri]